MNNLPLSNVTILWHLTTNQNQILKLQLQPLAELVQVKRLSKVAIYLVRINLEVVVLNWDLLVIQMINKVAVVTYKKNLQTTESIHSIKLMKILNHHPIGLPNCLNRTWRNQEDENQLVE